MSTRLNPYLMFRGQAEEAMTFYQSVLGGVLDVNTYAQFGGGGVPEAEQGQVMHSQLTTNDTVVLMGSDAPSTMPGQVTNGTVSISGDDLETIRGWFEALAEGGSVDLPFEEAPWGDHFGQVTDRFGVQWMFNSPPGR
ncbi:VOC family protein [Nocardioides dongxiaopingii]|uniref:VOC family protein n=1 Tax=Nocardioides sp. S-1144 TaxID=2582905 RepID=UPI00110E8E91|nr:VOC family protein [Nocardioides sp. S-1144]QCW51142.1 VOC family protein [Nocardioides sp. S-1144]